MSKRRRGGETDCAISCSRSPAHLPWPAFLSPSEKAGDTAVFFSIAPSCSCRPPPPLQFEAISCWIAGASGLSYSFRSTPVIQSWFLEEARGYEGRTVAFLFVWLMHYYCSCRLRAI